MRLCQSRRTSGLATASVFASIVVFVPFNNCAPVYAQACEPHFEALGTGTNSFVMSLLQFDEDGNGPNAPALFAGGYFTIAGGQQLAKGVARWDGRNWSALGKGINYGVAYAMSGFDLDGDGPNPPQLHAGGDLSLTNQFELVDVVHWDGAAWNVTGAGVGYDERDYVLALASFDDDGSGPNPPALYAGGWFFSVDGFNTAYSFAKWNGSNWQPIVNGVDNGVDGGVYAMTVFDDDGNGPNLPALFVAGYFSKAGSTDANSIAKFDGKNFTPLAAGIQSQFSSPGLVSAMTVFDDDGEGANAPALVVAGEFSQADGQPVRCIAKWNGSQWSALGTGIHAFDEFQMVYALASFDEDGAGPNPPRLFAAGKFAMAGGNAITNLARWDGTTWSAVGQGVNDPGWQGLTSLAVFDPDGLGGQPGALIFGGLVTMAGDVPVSYIAAWVGCEPTFGDINGDGNVNVQDMLAVINAWGACPVSCAADLNNDGVVNVLDLLAVVNNWGS